MQLRMYTHFALRYGCACTYIYAIRVQRVNGQGLCIAESIKEIMGICKRRIRNWKPEMERSSAISHIARYLSHQPTATCAIKSLACGNAFDRWPVPWTERQRLRISCYLFLALSPVSPILSTARECS